MTPVSASLHMLHASRKLFTLVFERSTDALVNGVLDLRARVDQVEVLAT